MSIFLPTLLNSLQQYGYAALWLAIFIAAVGVPLPVSLLLLAAGAFSALGDFNVFILALVVVSASVCGDNLGYVIGRLWGHKLLDRLERASRRRFFSPRAVARARAYFARRGGWAVFLSRFLISGLGGVINLLAGSSLYPYRRFLLADVGGETLEAVIPLGLGFVFGASWEPVGSLRGDISFLIVVLLVVVILSVYLVRTLHRARMATSNQRQTTTQTDQRLPDALPQPRKSGHLRP